ncbi:haloacid dehalogenase-like hydrolase-like protein [Leptomonas pyrrhocoris]|uniref:Haloacid dehalogenase-like hydrolase-like protein n=1 Tax=Leptomonas pyrrhocoris TaxID=157538 RepID=A0A0M9G983_LEPPY|nr:haloacid dehalogenase-like hydrolase-like protein [Leptomonas pyrrhocoris]KPA85363.1 haloacid dehalogenase-like hydrolase-like protein [Leptomonas pyrrhocoris]|eukprot:XP_015663802.1 haloacid dehalogenase-like hydrolase-like protein [Leptomonas pyrrhocoris]
MSAAFRYVVSDMDGTLFSPDHVISDYTRDTLKALVHKHGVTLILATGRHYADVKVIADNLKQYIWGDDNATGRAPSPANPSRAPMMYLLTSNGAIAHNAVTHELVFQTCVDPLFVEKLYHHLPDSEEVVNTNVYQQEDWICRIDWPWTLQIYKESGISYRCVPNAPPRSAEPVPSTAPSGWNRGVAVGNYDDISKVFFLSYDTDRLQSLVSDVEAIAKSCGGTPFSLTFSSFMCLDIMAEGVCKGQALRKLLEIAVSPKEGRDVVAEALEASIAFGDGLNDAEMLTEVGKGCVMGNATPKLMEQHPELEVVLPNSENGVAEKLRTVFGIPAS